MNNYDYPLGADNNSAPWNEKELPPIKIPVTVSITMSKQFEVELTDYKVEESEDEDGKHLSIDTSNCDLKTALQEQVLLPHESFKLLDEENTKYTKMYKDLKDWCVDDFEVIPE